MIANYTAMNFTRTLLPSSEDTQFIKIDGKVKRNLCGQFCAAFAVSAHVKDMVHYWRGTSAYAELVTTGDKTTGLYALQTMLDLYGHAWKVHYPLFDAIKPLSVDKFAAILPAIVGVGITNQGVIKADGYIRHWIVACQVARLGDDDGLPVLVRVYNPYHNRIEDVLLSDITDQYGRISQAVQVYADWQYDRIAVPSTDTPAGLQAENTALRAELSAIKNMARDFCMEVNG